MSKRKEKIITFLRKKTDEKQNSATIMSVDGKQTVSPVKLKVQGETFE